jgi:hypothetical protein
MGRTLEQDVSKSYPAELLQKAIGLRAAGMKWETIANRLNVGSDGLKRRLDPEYRERRNQQMRDANERRTSTSWPMHHFASRMPQEQLDRLRATVPVDTRGLTARACGDPLPGRSALDKYRANATSKVSRERTVFEFSPLISKSHRDDQIGA